MAGPFDGVILIAHGARDARWLAPFSTLRNDLGAELAPIRVALAFMEFASPTIADAADELEALGARRILVVPVFLAGGGHVAQDIPALVDAARTRHAKLSFDLAGALGEEREVVAGMLAAVRRLCT
jgi:sirohydrochlorin cobaltochelatase